MPALEHTRVSADPTRDLMAGGGEGALAAIRGAGWGAAGAVAVFGSWRILDEPGPGPANPTYDRPVWTMVLALLAFLVIVGLLAALVLPRLERAAIRWLVRRRLRAAGSPAALAEVAALPDGRAVIVQGRIRRRVELRPMLGGAPCVFRQVRIRIAPARWRSGIVRPPPLVHEAGEDFDLVDDAGGILLVRVPEARLVCPAPEWTRPDGAALAAVGALEAEADPPTSIGELARALGRDAVVRAGERALRQGDRVTVFGYKDTIVGAARGDASDTALWAYLCSGADLPLVIMG